MHGFTSISAPLIATHLDGSRRLFRSMELQSNTAKWIAAGYMEIFFPLANARRIELLDHSRLRQQLLGLERKTSRLKDIIDHVRGAHDDLANSACLALVSAAGTLSGPAMWTAFAEKWPEAPSRDAVSVVDAMGSKRKLKARLAAAEKGTGDAQSFKRGVNSLFAGRDSKTEPAPFSSVAKNPDWFKEPELDLNAMFAEQRFRQMLSNPSRAGCVEVARGGRFFR